MPANDDASKLRRGSRADRKLTKEEEEELMSKMKEDLAEDAVWKKIQQNTFTRYGLNFHK